MIEVIHDGNLMHVSRPLGDGFWHIYVFRRRSPTEPFSVNEQLVANASWCDSPSEATVVAPPSQLEYAYIAESEDIGGSTHRNERVDTLRYHVGCELSPLPTTCQTVSAFQLTQELTSFTAQGDLAKVKLIHKITTNTMRVAHKHEWLRQSALGWYYAAMMPVWNNGVHDTLVHGGQTYLFNDYLGQNNALEFVPEAYFAQAQGTLYGRPIEASVSVNPIGVNNYANARPFWQINRGAQDDWSKWYAQRANAPNPETVNAGDVWRADNFYKLTLG